MKKLQILFLLVMPLVGLSQTNEQMEMALTLKQTLGGVNEELLICGMMSKYQFSPKELIATLFQEKVYPELKKHPTTLITLLANYGKARFTEESIKEGLYHHYQDQGEYGRRLIDSDLRFVAMRRKFHHHPYAGTYDFNIFKMIIQGHLKE